MIRRAEERDLAGINSLLYQVAAVHHEGRPDLFREGTKKYDDAELKQILANDSTPVFVLEEEGKVLGYAFCILQQHVGDLLLTDIKTLYIDDLCVDEAARGKHVGRSLYEYVLGYAKEIGCYNVTLNVWSCNESAKGFYEHCGLTPYKTGMEKIL